MGERLSHPPQRAVITTPPTPSINELARLPYEILVRVLIFAIDDTKRTPTYCHLRQTILSTPQLWGRIYCLLPGKMVKRFEMAAWNQPKIYAHLSMEKGK